MNRLDQGQLALMDAAVFFSVSLLVSVSLLAFIGDFTDAKTANTRDIWKDPHEILRVFLSASIGAELVIGLDSGVRIHGNEEIGECIAIEVQALTSGVDIECFTELNEVYLRILRSCSGPLFDPFLIVMCSGDNLTELALTIPHQPQNQREAYASSVEFPGLGGYEIAVSLVLSPASSSELP